MTQSVFLMSPPNRRFHVAHNANQYSIDTESVSPQEALKEWISVADMLTEYGATVVVMLPEPDALELCDLTYTADIGMWFNRFKVFGLSKMCAAHRRKEKEFVENFFEQKLGLRTLRVSAPWEGSSCVRMLGDQPIFGIGPRMAERAIDEVKAYLGASDGYHYALRMREPFFHLDTFCTTLVQGECKILVLHPEAITQPSFRDFGIIMTDATYRFGYKMVYIAESDALQFATNVRMMYDTRLERPVVVAPDGVSVAYAHCMAEASPKGMTIKRVSLPNLFNGGGGAIGCLTNDLTEALAHGWSPPEELLWPALRQEVAAMVDSYPAKEV